MSEVDIQQRPSRRLWFFAGLSALALHIGGAALAVAHLQRDDNDDGLLGASGVEIAFEMASPKLPDNELPPGPDTEMSQAAPERAERETEVKQADLPKDKPTEAENPDRIVTPNDSKQLKEDEPKIAAVQSEASQESIASEATAKKPLDENAPEAEQAMAPNAGIGIDKQKLTADWGRKISAYFQLHKHYPPDRQTSASVKVGLVLNRRGHVVSATVVESSGDAAFDEAAISMVRRSDPVPPPPAELTGTSPGAAEPGSLSRRRRL